MHWYYYLIQACISLGVYVVIKLNGRDKLYGWLIGAGIQLLQAFYGVLTGQWLYLLAVMPGIAFVEVFLKKVKEHEDNRRGHHGMGPDTLKSTEDDSGGERSEPPD